MCAWLCLSAWTRIKVISLSFWRQSFLWLLMNWIVTWSIIFLAHSVNEMDVSRVSFTTKDHYPVGWLSQQGVFCERDDLAISQSFCFPLSRQANEIKTGSEAVLWLLTLSTVCRRKSVNSKSACVLTCMVASFPYLSSWMSHLPAFFPGVCVHAYEGDSGRARQIVILLSCSLSPVANKR